MYTIWIIHALCRVYRRSAQACFTPLTGSQPTLYRVISIRRRPAAWLRRAEEMSRPPWTKSNRDGWQGSGARPNNHL